MTKLIIDLSDALDEFHPDDKVVVWSPVHREGVRGQVVNTRPKRIPLTQGKAEEEVEPGPLKIKIQCMGLSDTQEKEVVVPDQDTVTLWDLLEQDFTYTPPIISEVVEARAEVREAVARVGTAEQVGQWAEDAATSETNASNSASDALTIKNSIPATVQSEVDTRVPPKVAEVIGGDTVVRDAAAAAVAAEVEAIRWFSAVNLVEGQDFRDLPIKTYPVPGGAVATALGLPAPRVGSLEIMRGNTNNSSKMARFTTNDQGASSPLEIWQASTDQQLNWGSWKRVFPLPDDVVRLADLDSARWASALNLTRDQHYTDLPVGSYSVAGGGDATAIGLPVPRIGNLEILRGNFNNSIKIARFTTNYDPTSGIEIWHTATDTAGAWPGQWVRTDGAGDIDVTSQIKSALAGYATQDDVDAAISALPTGFGIDSDGIPYITIGA